MVNIFEGGLMEKIKTLFSIKIFIAFLLAVTFSSFTLWLIDSWIKYILFTYEIIAILLIFLIIENYEIKIILIHGRPLKLMYAVNLLIIAVPFVLLLMNFFHLSAELITASLALISTSLIPGYALLKLCKMDKYFSRLEVIVFSYLLSCIYTALAWLALLPLDINFRSNSLLISYIILGLLTAFRQNEGVVNRTRFPSLCKKIDGLAIILALGFYAISFTLIYPGFVLLSGTDLSHHYASSLVLGRTPDLYIGSVYLLAHLHESAFLYTANASLVYEQVALLMLNLMLPLAFYIMARRFLSNLDNRLPVLATLFWVLFTNSFGGFAWINFVQQKIQSSGQTQLQLLISTADKTYNGTIYGVLGLWYVPVTVSFVMLFALLSIIPHYDLPAKTFLILFSTIFTGMFLTHVTEAVILAIFLGAYGMISRRTDLRLNEVIVSIVLGICTVAIIYLLLSLFLVRFILDQSLLFSLLGPFIFLCSVWLIRTKFFKNVTTSDETSTEGRTYKTSLFILTLTITYFYVVALATSFSLTDVFHTYLVDNIGLVPWFMFPIMLGINGLLALFAFSFISKDRQFKKAYAFFTVFLVLTFILGRLVSFTNLNFFQVGYTEKRFVWFLKIPLALLAPIPLLEVARRLRSIQKIELGRTVSTAILVGVVATYGVSTTFLNLEYWQYATGPLNLPSTTEMEAIFALKTIIDNDPRSWVATITDTSSALATFASPPDQLVLKKLLYSANTPEMSFIQLYRHPDYSHPYLYIANRDYSVLNKYPDGFLNNYLERTPIVFKNSDVSIYNSSKPSFPQENSNTTLVLPYDNFLTQQQISAAYCALSLNSANYTVAYDSDKTILNSNTIILSYDPPQDSHLQAAFSNELKEVPQDWRVVSGSWTTFNGSLTGGEPNKYIGGIILTPFILNEFNASFAIKPLEFDPKIANYASLVYSFKDVNNYKCAEVFFNNDGFIYVYIRFVEGTDWAYGKTVPNWPGQNTGIKWVPSGKYEIKVSVTYNSTLMYVNEKQVLSIHTTNQEGRIGLQYQRFYKIQFTDFSLNGFKDLKLRPLEDYLKFLENGGTIIVLNTNGYHFFAGQTISAYNNTIEAEAIEGKSTISLPTNLTVPVFNPAKSASTIANYISPSKQTSAFIVEKTIENGNLIYVNIIPLIASLESTDSRLDYSTLASSLKSLALPKMGPQKIQADAYVGEIRLEKANLTSSSVLFPLKTNLNKVEITSSDQSAKYLNVTEIEIETNSPLKITSEKALIKAGNGLYSEVTLNSTFRIFFNSANETKLKIKSNGIDSTIKSVTEITIYPSKFLNLRVRTPKVEAEKVYFKETYSQGDLNFRTGAYGQDLEMEGKVSFEVLISDVFTLIKNVNIAGSWRIIPPLVKFDELAVLPMAIPWALILLPVFVFLILLRYDEQTERRRYDSEV
jgi:hypothetical protein